MSSTMQRHEELIQIAIKYHKEVEGEYGCNGLSCPGVQRLLLLLKSADESTGERVDHPAHYNAHPSGIEAIEICESYNFNVGNAIKYLWRAGLKGEALEDLRKAAWYVDREIARIKKEQAK